MSMKAKGENGAIVPTTGPRGVVDVAIQDPTMVPDARKLGRYKFIYTVKLVEGRSLEGIFRGLGVPVDTVDEKTGEVRQINTWLIETDRVTIRLLGGANLDNQLKGGAIGSMVAIVAGGMVDTRKGFRTRQHLVGWDQTQPGE